MIQLDAVDGEGNTIPFVPTMSIWYTRYVVNPQLTCPKFHRKFRLRFRLPYASFVQLLELVKVHDLFQRWMSCDAVHKKSSPIELMALGALRILGRGWTCDDLEEATGISEETHRQFFHIFIKFGREDLFERFVVQPINMEQAEQHMEEYRQAGFHGAIGSTDATHVISERIEHSISNIHRGAKLPGTARTYNLTCNHRRRILSTTTGHPSRWNDKTLVRFDAFVHGIWKGNILDDVEFELLARDENGDVCSCKYRGVWLLVDNGYLAWSTTMPPFKRSLDYKEIRWSEWLESMRKDVECTFGILKGRWRILKTGVRVHGTLALDNIWCTCCALHNFLLEVDGLDVGWEGEDGLHDLEDVPLSIQRLHSPDECRNFDRSGMGRGRRPTPLNNEQQEELQNDPAAMTAVVRIVRKLPFDFFRACLVEHFDILYQQNKIVWPSRK